MFSGYDELASYFSQIDNPSFKVFISVIQLQHTKCRQPLLVMEMPIRSSLETTTHG